MQNEKLKMNNECKMQNVLHIKFINSLKILESIN